MIGDGHPCFITFELGPTHDGVASAKRLIQYAANAGADAVKVQIFDPDRLVADKKQLFSYSVLKDGDTGELETVEEPLYDILVRRCLSEPDWVDVKKYDSPSHTTLVSLACTLESTHYHGNGKSKYIPKSIHTQTKRN